MFKKRKVEKTLNYYTRTMGVLIPMYHVYFVSSHGFNVVMRGRHWYFVSYRSYCSARFKYQ